MLFCARLAEYYSNGNVVRTNTTMRNEVQVLFPYSYFLSLAVFEIVTQT
jgi:hypothetical protein